jgi:hypothetical protein
MAVPLIRVPERRVSLEVVPPTGPGILVNGRPGATQLRVTARIDKAIGGAPGQARITVQNLDQESRDRAQGIIRRPTALDPWATSVGSITQVMLEQALGNGQGQEAAIIAAGGGVVRLSAGFDPSVAVLFTGSSEFADSRETPPNWLTEIIAGDGGPGMSLAQASKDFPTGTPFWQVIDYCRRLIGLGVGTQLPAQAPLAVTQTQLRAPLSIMGQARKILEQALALLGVDWWIDDGDLYLVGKGEALPVPPHRFSSTLGEVGAHLLLARPQPLDASLVGIRAQLAPPVRLGHPVVLATLQLPGTYRIVGLAHDVDNRGGPFTTSLTLEPLGLQL